jgi:hypothetical protein
MSLLHALIAIIAVFLVATESDAAFLTSSQNPAQVGELVTITLRNETGGTFGATILTEAEQVLGSAIPVGPGVPSIEGRLSLSFSAPGTYVIHAFGYIECPFTSNPTTCVQSQTAPFTQVIIAVQPIPTNNQAAVVIMSVILCSLGLLHLRPFS